MRRALYRGVTESGPEIRYFAVHAGCMRRWCSAASGSSRGDRPTDYDVPPPRPAFYVPPEERASDDASLQFLRKDSGVRSGLMKGCGDATGEVKLEPGQLFAPEPPVRPAESPSYINEKAARLSSTSVRAGASLLTGDIGAEVSRLAVVKNSTSTRNRSEKTDASPPLTYGGSKGSIFESRDVADGVPEGKKIRQHEGTVGRGEEGGETTGGNPTGDELPLLQQMQVDLRRLEYYQGTPQYPEMLKEFRAKYLSDGGSEGEGDGRLEDLRSYTQEELARGLESQPIDYLRASSKLKVELTSGPRAYDPVLVMQQMGVMRFQGYAFPPTTELGRLCDSDGKLPDSSEGAHRFAKYVAQTAPTAIKDQLKGNEDRHILYRTMGLDVVQRRQVKAMLSDFDHGDRHTSYHVMMSYPYADWLHVFYMVLVGVAIYEMQVRFCAYDFYDEYLGLDLRQVPKLKKPFLVTVTVVVMVVALFHPLLLVSIATTRLYRIAMKRPVGPP
ncbi:hypothetical protein, conserved [Trypanosoma brucei gambiense DAL972]|nr:hypothetical protein, conserved [Trypanosoma brucei gambiense DAL972]CBH10212.1 hypothetical protein, conserved [Trypanosoma brucei gambiense DAL972]|eukprot:XP_011772502.1 hypothetical protein, conserved [Trypanosoma brucei gambiense DAL972]